MALDFPETLLMSLVYMRLGECYQKKAKWQEAKEYFHKVIMPDFKKKVLPLIVLVLLLGLTVPLRYLIIDWRLYIIISLVIFSISIYINRRLKKRSRSQPQNFGSKTLP